eukprot:2954260-Pyramimonas_sp.AAC.1
MRYKRRFYEEATAEVSRGQDLHHQVTEHKLNRLAELSRAWAPAHRKLKLRSIVDSEGAVSRGPEACAAALAKYWGDVAKPF